MSKLSRDARDDEILPPGPSAPQPLTEQHLRDVAAKIKEALLPGYHFTLIIFDDKPQGHLHYLSTGERADMMATMRALLNKWQRGE